MKKLLWINDYNLEYQKDNHDDEKIFIFSKQYLGLIAPNRLKLIYQQFIANKIRVFKGEYIEILKYLLTNNRYNKIIIPTTIEQEIINAQKILSKSYSIEYVDNEALLFSQYPEKRFFKFWNIIKNKI